MKKSIIFLLFIFLVQATMAISSDMKQVYQPAETLIAEISGNILEPIPKENVMLLRGHVPVAFEYDIKKIEGSYYLYAILPPVENNYTLVIKDISTTINGNLQKVDFTHNLSTSGELIDYNINPGFIITNKDFEVSIFLNEDFEKAISIDFPEEKNITIMPGNNKVIFSINDAEAGFRKIKVGKYEMPVLIIKELFSEIKFFPKTLTSTILFSQTPSYTIKMINTGDDELLNISFIYNKDLFFIEPDSFEPLPPNEAREFNLTIRNQNDSLYQIIFVKTESSVFKFVVNISYTENISEVTTYLDENYSESEGYYCLELGGKTCSSDESCSSETLSTLDSSSCCIGSCTVKEEKSSSWVGYLIAGLLIIVVIFIIIKYQKGKKNTNAETTKIIDLQKKKA